MVKTLVIGSGGREHAICLKLAESHRVETIYISPGNAGTGSAKKCQNVSLDLKDFEAVGSWCKQTGISLVIVGPEDPLANGIVNVLSQHGISCFGPSKAAAQIEASKEFAKRFMDRHNIPTAKWSSFTDAEKACQHIQSAPYKALVVKASGLAGGKGVIVAQSQNEAQQAVRSILQGEFGAAGETVVIEELLEGHEVSCLAFSDGRDISCFPAAQDHKRVGEGDTGPNTGGMGAYAPCPLISAADLELVKRDVLQKAVDGMAQDGNPYKGVLYAGMMLTKDGPKVLEYNCRFGDPETQVILPLLKSDLYDAMLRCVEGSLHQCLPVFYHDKHVVAIVLVSGGYPGSYQKGRLISGLDLVESEESVSVVHAGTSLVDGHLVTNGGRVLAIVAQDSILENAIQKSMRAVRLIHFQDSYYRKDIGKRALLTQKSFTYVDAGVSIQAGNDLVTRIIPFAKSTSRTGCQVDLGMFGGMFDVKAAGFTDPILVSGTDGVGTKLKIAQLVGRHHTIGQDLVAMCVNDILAHGAEPLFFLDYFACGRLDNDVASDVIEGVAKACKMAGCALLGGETAEMPGMYKFGDYDLAGFTVGAVERTLCLPKMDQIKVDDVIIGLSSSGIHSNGYSLVRKLVDSHGFDYSMPCPFEEGKTLGDALLTPTKLYVKSSLPALRSGKVKAFAHITGGGLLENIPRVLPSKLGARLDASKWPLPAVFRWLAEQGNISETEMSRTFNCGLGAILITSRDDVAMVTEMFKNQGEPVYEVGRVSEICGAEGGERVAIKNLNKELGTKNPKNSTLSFSETSINGNFLKPKGKVKVGVLISGTGTNLRSLIDHTTNSSLHSCAEIVLVISNVAGVKGLEIAEKAGIETMVIPHKGYKNRLDFDMEVDCRLRQCGVQIVVLAGFMRILTGEFVSKWSGHLLNVHPSLLPSFRGSDAHRQVLEAGVRISGCSVHFVTAEIDAGAILIQESVPVFHNDTESSLQERVKMAEHKALPAGLEMVASGRAKMDVKNNKVLWYEPECNR